MSRWVPVLLIGAAVCISAQQPKQRPATEQPKKEQQQAVPPEEDKSLAVDPDYAFNPLQSEKEIQTGNFYFKKGNYRAAAFRFREATRWNNGSADAWLRLAEAEEKLKDHKAAREAYTKYLEVASDAKNGDEIRKKIEKLK